MQEEAANAVAALTDSCWLPQILHHLDDPSPLARRVMLWTLRNYAGQISYPQFLAYLHDPDMAVREAALLLFMEGGSPACDALVTAAVSSEEEEIRFSAVQALGQFRTPEAIAPLMHAAGAKNPDIREVAVLSLGVYTDACVIPQLLAALADDPQIRLAALEGLRGRELSSEDLVQVSGCLSDAEFPDIRAAAEAAGKQGYMMEDVLLPLLSDAVPGVRPAAVTALASSRRPDVVATLIDCLHDPKPWVQAAAATSLGEIGGDEVIATLPAASKSGNAILRGIMKNALNAALKK